jgi:hypothetical protein
MELQFLEIVKIRAIFSTLMLKYESSIKAKHTYSISSDCYISLSREHIPHRSALCSLNFSLQIEIRKWETIVKS